MSEPWEVWMATKRSAFDSKQSVYGRSTSVEIGTAKCEICETTTTIMSIDGSGGEYGSFDCCKPCFDKLWTEGMKDGRERYKVHVAGWTLTPGVLPGNIWISDAGGEGGDFHIHELAEVIGKFYKEKF